MIPLKLKLSNFTSYGENPPELDFSKFHLAAISGLNGAGKSSLLDSITWCLWGSSRAGDSADSLIRLGAENMFVEFTFMLDNNSYSVKRLRSKKSGGHTTLEFWSGTHNLTEGTIKATQQKIIDTLHLTFETFSNSAFIRQGHADEFTTKGATDRKRILADILGLDHYDKLEEKAKEKTKEIQTQLTVLEYKLVEIESELALKEERTKSLTQAEQEAKETESKLKEIEIIIKSLEEEQNLIISQIKILEEKRNQIESVQKEITDLKLQIALKEKIKTEYASLLSQKQEIEKNYKEYESLDLQKKSLETKRTELIKLKDELSAIQSTLKQREEKRQLAVLKKEVEIKELQTKIDELKKQNEQLSNKKDVCPTCNQVIGAELNLQIVNQNNKLISENEEILATHLATLKAYKDAVLPEVALIEEKISKIKKIEEDTKAYFELTTKQNELLKYKDLFLKLSNAENAYKSQDDAIDELSKMLVSRESQIEKSLTDLEDLKLFENKLVEKKLDLNAKLEIKNDLSRKALEARGKVGEAKVLVSRFIQLEELLKTESDKKSRLKQEKEIYDELSLAFGKKGIQAMIIESAIPEIEEETNRLLARLTDGRMQIKLETQKETKTKIQTAEGKVHTTVETLDIVISDEMGERAYELYSGGETFRVNFAIRLAISKLLANRSGASLQFLVIDEGFGTQDTPGRARLVEVLDVIKNDFEKIVIITHIEELKEEFPVRIEVVKGASGSTFEVIGI